jgi:hypothetical protein
VLHNGDWLGMLVQKLQQVPVRREQRPNATVHDMIERARDWR